MTIPTIFLLGATGYVGGEFLILLGRKLPQLPVLALVRHPTAEKITKLHSMHANVSVVEGSLDDLEIVKDQAAKADIVINIASGGHSLSSQAILEGMTEHSARKPGEPPLLIHISGLAVLSDDARGELVKDVKVWSDIGFNLKSVPPDNVHLDVDIPIVEAGTRKDNPIRTIILFPGLIYGVGQGVQRTTVWIRTQLKLARDAGYAGTWGPGYNAMSHVHVKDVASAILVILKAALEHKADEGAEGLYFVASDAPKVTKRECQAVIGDYLFSKGIIKQPGSQPFTKEFITSLASTDHSSDISHLGWRTFGGNQLAKSERLAKLGWVPVETFKHPILDTLFESLDAAL
ncbi:unnamed protein product [Somion occarium]|uniref:NAD(P)-binding domain-containing protein n=1 Tax=Somion occarium TaxID=3059160 RepID=A0ABP1D6F0_9APHY